MFTDDQLLPISALQHWLYCPRQCGLIHLERAWLENKFTAEGRVLHKKAHDGADETKAGVLITRGMDVRSLELGIAGQCDVVEFRAAGTAGGGDLRSVISDLKGNGKGDLTSEISDIKGGRRGGLKSQISDLKSLGSVRPVEYKRGKPKSHRADEVQLCAQAMCLEEMLGVAIPEGYLYYGEKHRRTEIAFDSDLRQLVAETAVALHAMIDSRVTPMAEYDSRRCDACSLIELCQPKALRFKRGAQAWFSQYLKSQI